MRIFLESATDRIELSTSYDATYFHGDRTSGFGVPTMVSRMTRGPGDGARYRGIRADTRVCDVNVIVQGADRRTVEAAFLRLTDIVVPSSGAPLPQLSAEYDNGTVLKLPFVYRSGLEIGSAELFTTHAEFLIAMECPAPYWTARDALSFSFENPATATPFLDDLANLPVASSLIGASLIVTNPGNVPANLTVLLKGPSSGNSTFLVDGAGWVFHTALSTSEMITITRTAGGITVLDQTGANRYGDLDPAPKFPTLPPGTSTVATTMVGATTASNIRGNWFPRFKGIY